MCLRARSVSIDSVLPSQEYPFSSIFYRQKKYRQLFDFFIDYNTLKDIFERFSDEKADGNGEIG
jgi:hypothetical protein